MCTHNGFSVNGLTRKGLHKESFSAMFSYGCRYYARQLLKQCHVSIFNTDVLENIYEMDEAKVEKINFEVYGSTLCTANRVNVFRF